MPSEQRLHPFSILFRLGAEVRRYALPGLLVLLTAGVSGGDWQVWTMLLLVPGALVSIVRYASFRYRCDESELVIRTGFLFRNERHVPYERIQNLDAVQNPLHRLLGVVEVRVETGGGQEPEARMTVLPVAALEEMRRRVFGDHGRPEAAADPAVPSLPPDPDRALLHLPPRELLLCGLIHNRGAVVIAAGFGLLWELGILDGLAGRAFGEGASGRAVARDVVRAFFGQGGLPVGRVALTLGALAGLLLAIRLFSVGWALVRLHGFRLRLAGEDLRTEFGLITRVTATIPRGRIQTLTIREGPFHRLFGRVSVRVDTAGGKGGEAARTQREWLAPIVRREALPDLVLEVLPGLDLAAVDWRGPHPRAFRRAFREFALVAALIALPFAMLLAWWDLVLLAVLLGWALVAARFHVAHLAWAVTAEAVLFRSGWILGHVGIAPFAKIQAVAIHESPFDRRAAMARVRVDTAGAGDASHRVDIPYLPRETARDLCGFLAAQAAGTAFRW